MNIYVGNLPYNVTEADLVTAFSTFGQVASVTLVNDKFSGQSKGFGFIEMPDNGQAEAAIKALHETPFKGRTMTVNQARPKTEHPRRPTRSRH